MPLPRVEVVVVALGSPILVGLYKEGELFKTYQEEAKTSEALPRIFEQILEQYDLERIYFARGPGSFMSIKLVYIFLETLRIARGIETLGCDGFVFSAGKPIKAMGNLYFVKEGDRIVTRALQDTKSHFTLPHSTQGLPCSDQEKAPLYLLPAV